MKKFVLSKEFKDLNVGATLDEGITCESEEFVVFYAERCPWRKFCNQKKKNLK